MKAQKTRDIIGCMKVLIDWHKNGGIEEIEELERLARIGEAVEKASKLNPYRVVGNHDTYSQYNEGWQACIDYIESVSEGALE